MAQGVVTLLNDLSNEVAVRTLPHYLANVLGVKAGIIGLIEGLAESTATLLKVVSGVLADRVGKKKALALWGYGLSGFTKPLLFFAAGWPLVLVVRVLDRIGKGIRTAPRDALIADVTAPEARGRAFGFNKAMATTGPSRERPAPSWPIWFRPSCAGRPTVCSTGPSAWPPSRRACSRGSSGTGTVRPNRFWPTERLR